MFRKMQKSDIIWIGIIATGTVYELYVIKVDNDSTLSVATRRLFRVHTRRGQVVFTGFVLGVSGWFLKHVLQPSNSAGNVIKNA